MFSADYHDLHFINLSQIQILGRGRAEGSKCILITYNSKLTEQEENNVLKERLMTKALSYVQSNKQDLEARVGFEIDEKWLLSSWIENFQNENSLMDDFQVTKQLKELHEGIRREDELAREKIAKFAGKNDNYQILCK